MCTNHTRPKERIFFHSSGLVPQSFSTCCSFRTRQVIPHVHYIVPKVFSIQHGFCRPVLQHARCCNRLFLVLRTCASQIRRLAFFFLLHHRPSEIHSLPARKIYLFKNFFSSNFAWRPCFRRRSVRQDYCERIKLFYSIETTFASIQRCDRK